MINLFRMSLIVLVGVAIWAFAPAVAHAAKVHIGSNCTDCHTMPGANPRGMTNLCTICHSAAEPTTSADFVVGDASNALGGNPSATGNNSHYWGGSSTARAAAGSAHPPTTYYRSSYGISTNRVTCSICHDPHGQAGTKLVRAATAGDLICQQCHSQWYVANPDARLTHPIVANYLANFAASDARFKPATADANGRLSTNVGSGDVRLVNGGVSCTSCHATHFTDSNSTTTDGKGMILSLGDGKLLRSDGPERTNADPLLQAQLRSNLCQACHAYLVHGNSADGGPQIGCLDCHGGHSYNGGVPNVFVLSGSTSTPQPRIANAVGTSTFPPYTGPYAGGTNEVWSNKAVGIAGYCEECHGDVQAAPISGKSTGHSVGNGNPCTTCHLHGGSGWTHSWQPDVSAATCGDCHGFPPYLSVPGDRNTGGTDGGYALSESDGTPAPWDYLNDSGAYKLEATTAHNTHAGGSATNPTLYFVGTTGTENCNVCHGDNSGFNALHRDDTRAASFRDVPFNSVSSVSGGPAPVYYTSGVAAQIWNCDNIYCHTNGGPKDNAGVQSWVYNRTPDWDAAAAAGGKNYILLNANRCQFCHGNNAATMTTKANSAVHNKHLNKGYTCNVCHVNTATSNTALAAGATRGNLGGNNGKHVNKTADVNYDLAYDLDTTAATRLLTVGGTPYNAANGTCQVYCHSNGMGTFATPDWQVASISCTSCHGNPPTSGSHPRHISDVNGPTLACAECHVNAATYTTAGGHADHQNGAVTVDNARCTTCHGVDGAETVPVWGNPITSDCKTCHTGSATSTIETRPAPAKANALSSGHGKPSGSYASSLNIAANRDCTVCHASSAVGHFDGDALDKRLILGSSGFPAAYSTVADKNNYCGACHGGTPGHPAPSSKIGVNTHQAKPCIGCHDPHGDSNVYMVLTSQTTQNTKDTTATGKFFGNVTFSALTAVNSYDEDDGAVGGAGEANADDLCATCHTVAANTSHNNRDNSVVDHNQGADCFSCHKTHTDATAPFGAGAGNACNSCHGNPPATAAHARHALVASHDKDVEDRTDCAYCHTGANLYTYDPSADQGAGRNHGNAAGRKTLLGTAVGYVAGDGTCTSACHATSVADGAWSDANGLNCTACHYAAAEPSATGANNTAAGTRKLSELSHNKHFDKDKTCSACHDVSYSPTITAVAGPLTHINDFTTAGAADDGAAFADKGAATQDEALVVRASMTFDDNLNTCSGGIGLGCHATGTPDWDITIPANGCTQCHTNFTDATVNPTSGIHDVVPTVSGKQHDDSFTYNGGASTAYCDTCHSTTPSTQHQNGVFNATIGAGGNTIINLAAAVGYIDATTPTCGPNGTLITCHTDDGVWKRKWHDNAAATNGTQCVGCHGDWALGWNTGVTHRTDANPRTTHGSGTSYQCRDCHGLEASAGYAYANTTNDWAATDGGATTKHGDSLITMNSNGTTFARGTAGNLGKSGCASCHAAFDGTVTPQHAFTTTTWTLATVAADAPAVGCFSCHGGATTGVSKKNYWPDGANTQGDNGTADNSGEHAVHLAKLAQKVYGETITGAADNDILRDNTTLNPALTSDVKQKELCSYCHNTPGADGDHGNTYPADVNTMYTLWSKTLDNGVYTGASATCATVDCHNNKSTTTAYDWYDGAASACVMCHVDVTNGAVPASNGGTHVAHTGSAATFGRNITCDDCHKTATETVAWGTPGTAPTNNHINGIFAVTGTVPFTYSANTCGTNVCHNNGKNAATPAYTWATPIAGCTACHGDTTATLTTQSHAVHTGSTIRTIACGQCHAAATAATHIDANISFGGSVTFTYTGDVAITGSTFGGCGTNNCHNNGKNAAPRTAAYTWGTTIATTCGECHGDTVATLTSQAHAAHLNASATYGRTIACSDCHSAATNLTNHVNATIDFTGLTYSGDVAITGTTYGSCGTNACHENGLGAAPAQATYNWDTTIAGCSFCHNSVAMASGAHTTHLATTNAWGPYPVGGSTNCGECHQANANNTSMAAQTSHLNGSNDFAGATTLGTTTSCNACHGGATPAATAKTNWAAATRVTCESCHGQYSAAVIVGKTAPLNAGASYTTYGHNKVTNNPTYGGKACADCHNNTAVGHLDGTTGDDKRMKIVNTRDYTASANTFCASACHSTVMNVHYANTNTAGGTSDDGVLCMTCHNPHGQNGNQDAMIRSTIAGRAVTGFTNKTLRASFSQAGFNGVCQACHDGGEVGHFNRTTNETTHNSPTLCTDCHSHTATTAFSAAGGGCNSCHGYPPVQRLTGAGAAYTYAKVEDYPGGGRAHAVVAHINPTGLDPTDGWLPCAPCHTETDHNMGYGVGNLLAGRDASATWSNEATRYPRVNVSATYDKGGSGFYNMNTRNTTSGMGNCSNTSCHFGESPKWDCIPADTTNDPL